MRDGEQRWRKVPVVGRVDSKCHHALIGSELCVCFWVELEWELFKPGGGGGY